MVMANNLAIAPNSMVETTEFKPGASEAFAEAYRQLEDAATARLHATYELITHRDVNGPVWARQVCIASPDNTTTYYLHESGRQLKGGKPQAVIRQISWLSPTTNQMNYVAYDTKQPGGSSVIYALGDTSDIRFDDLALAAEHLQTGSAHRGATTLVRKQILANIGPAAAPNLAMPLHLHDDVPIEERIEAVVMPILNAAGRVARALKRSRVAELAKSLLSKHL